MSGGLFLSGEVSDVVRRGAEGLLLTTPAPAPDSSDGNENSNVKI